MAWLTGWNKRKSKTINGSTAGIQTDYQMKQIVHKYSGTDTSTDIYLDTFVRDDFGDIRFTQSDETTLLSYWIESITGTSPNLVATIWIKIPSIPESPSSINIYIYYDNSSATSLSSGTDTFPFYDHFLGTSLDGKWASGAASTNYGSGLVTVSDSIVTLRGGTNTWWYLFSRNVTFFPVPFIIEFYAKTDSGGFFGTSNTGSISLTDGAFVGFFGYSTHNNGTGTDWGGINPVSTYKKVRMEIYTGAADFYIDNTLMYHATVNIPDSPMGVGLWAAQEVGHSYVDYVFIRKYANPEPSFSIPLGDLYISSTPPGANIYIDDILQQGITPLTLIDISAGYHTYKLTLENYLNAEGIFEIINQQTTTVDITLIQKIGTLDISSNPIGAEIFIDDIDTGLITPLLLTNIIAGSHTYKLTLPNYYDVEGIFDIAINRTTTIFVELIQICVPNWLCEQPLNGYESDGCGNRRLNSLCNPCVPNWKCELPYNGYEYDGCNNRRQNPKCSIQPFIQSIEQFAASSSFLLMFGAAVIGVILIRKNYRMATLKKRKYK